MLQSLFSEVGIAGVGFLLIIAGVALAQIGGVLEWAKFCISLGIAVIFIILASKWKHTTAIILGIIGGCSFVAAIIFLVNALS